MKNLAEQITKILDKNLGWDRNILTKTRQQIMALKKARKNEFN